MPLPRSTSAHRPPPRRAADNRLGRFVASRALRKHLFRLSLLFLLSLLVYRAPSEQAASLNGLSDGLQELAPHRPTADQIITQLLKSNKERQSQLSSYVVPTTYRVVNSTGKVRAEAEVRLRYSPPGIKEFQVISETGSSLVRDRVFKPLMEVEAESASGRNGDRGAISPANYSFSLVGEERIDGSHCYLLQVEPKRVDKYLFQGKIWIDSKDYAVVRIAGQLAKSPSFWISRVDFVRSYRRVGTHWLPSRNESITRVRISGRNVLTIDYGAYQFLSS